LCASEILEREIAQARYRIGDLDLPRGDGAEQRSEIGRIHGPVWIISVRGDWLRSDHAPLERLAVTNAPSKHRYILCARIAEMPIDHPLPGPQEPGSMGRGRCERAILPGAVRPARCLISTTPS